MKLVLQIALGIILAPVLLIVGLSALVAGFAIVGENLDMVLIACGLVAAGLFVSKLLPGAHQASAAKREP